MYTYEKRKPRCSYCYERGHTRNGCEKMKQHIKDNPNSYAAHRHKEYLERAKTRSCSYCKQTGHNRKKCKDVFQDTLLVAEMNTKFRRKFLQTMREKGLGPGALLKVHDSVGYGLNGEYYSGMKDQLCLVTDINTNVFCPSSSSDNMITCVKVQYCNLYEYNGKPSERYLQIPYWFAAGMKAPKSLSERYFNKTQFDIVSPGHFMSEQIKDEETWINDKETINGIVLNVFNSHNKLMNQIRFFKEIIDLD